jgi:hypothetical protein
MTDRELLELAAKAAGYKVDQRASFKTWRDSRRLALVEPKGGHTLWNAVEEDGDALRLAVALRISLDMLTHIVDATTGTVMCHEPWGDDHCAAARRAIVRIAAEIGKAMP